MSNDGREPTSTEVASQSPTVRRNRIVFWQEALYGDRTAYERALAEQLPEGHVAIVVGQRATTNFKGGVWGDLDVARAEVVVGLDSNRARELLETEPQRCVHIFSSFVRSRVLRQALQRACNSKAMVGLLSEARNWRGWEGIARQCHSVFGERRYRDRADFVLAIGHLGQEWFISRCGYPPAKVFPWCYVSESPPAGIDGEPGEANGLSGETGATVRIVFVGALIDRKAVDVLLRALATIDRKDWRLTVLGGGERDGALKALAHESGIAEQVKFSGMMPNTMVRRYLQTADLLVLPSHWDGWGAVVNEALMAGVPVICSDWCGAKVLIHPGWNGDVFRAGSVADLTRVLDAWIQRGPLPPAYRNDIRDWARCLSGEVIAKYLTDILAYVSGEAPTRPTPPWNMRRTVASRIV